MTISQKRLKEIEAMRDEDIDYSDIPETDAAFWADAEFRGSTLHPSPLLGPLPR